MKHNEFKIKKGRFLFRGSPVAILATTLKPMLLPLFIHIIYLFPAFFSLSCSKAEQTVPEEIVTHLEINSKVSSSAGHLDIFIYNLDSLGRLDSYSRQKYTGDIPTSLELGSRSGRKRVIMLVNWQEERLEWSSINCLANIKKIMVDLDTEDDSFPRMSGDATITAGAASGGVVNLQTLSARIRLTSIKCDFSGKAYANLTMKNTRIYLTNVCINSSIVPEDVPGTAFINVGGLAEGDMRSFGRPEMLLRDLPGDIGAEERRPGLDFYCYASDTEASNPGKPQPKMVIEGEIGGIRYYYPILLADYIGSGIRRNTTYNVNLVISRLGGADQDTPLSPGTMQVNVEAVPWDSRGAQDIDF